MLLPLLLALAPQSVLVTVDNPESIYDLGAVPVASQPLQGPTSSFWSRTSRVVQLDLPLAYNPTGIAERWTLGLPDGRIYNGDAVVLFHGQQHHYQVPLPLIQDLNAAGYIVIVPQGGQHTHFGSQISSDITEGVLRWVCDRWPVERMFAYGFSHGGGSSASFVARHPGWFTGLLQHTGTVDLPASWVLDPGQNNTAGALEVIYNGPPSANPFDYERMSTKGSVMGANLDWTPTVTATGSVNDGTWNGQLWPETVAWEVQLNCGYLGPYAPASHAWSNVPYADVLTWLQGPHGTPTLTGDLAVDQSRRWGPLDVTQGARGQFSGLRFDYQPDRVDLSLLNNVSTLEFDVNELGLNTGSGQEIRVHAVGSPVLLRLHGFAVQPQVISGPAGTSQWQGGILELNQTAANSGWVPWVLRIP